MKDGKFTVEEVTALVAGARKVNRHDVAVALQAYTVANRFAPEPGDFDAAALIDIISDVAIRSVRMPHDPQKLERKTTA